MKEQISKAEKPGMSLLPMWRKFTSPLAISSPDEASQPRTFQG